ncbi:MAG TPA: cytochrome c oxidase subunit 4 [Ktedonobacteraceae bacterium]
MDSSPQSASFTPDESNASLLEQREEGEEEEEKPHIHLPNPSYWPILLSLGVAITISGIIFVSTVPWVTLLGIIFVFICIMGWALENPMARLKDVYVRIYRKVDLAKFKIGQNVVDSQRLWLGKVEARFSRYLLVQRGRLFGSVYYVPRSATRDEIKNNTVFLTLSEADLLRMGLNNIPDDLYDEVPESGVPVVRGAAQFARRPLSPAETGHYSYGRRSPGMNTDASGSYRREEVLPRPQTYVTEGVYTTDEPIPARVISPD